MAPIFFAAAEISAPQKIRYFYRFPKLFASRRLKLPAVNNLSINKS